MSINPAYDYPQKTSVPVWEDTPYLENTIKQVIKEGKWYDYNYANLQKLINKLKSGVITGFPRTYQEERDWENMHKRLDELKKDYDEKKAYAERSAAVANNKVNYSVKKMDETLSRLRVELESAAKNNKIDEYHKDTVKDYISTFKTNLDIIKHTDNVNYLKYQKEFDDLKIRYPQFSDILNQRGLLGKFVSKIKGSGHINVRKFVLPVFALCLLIVCIILLILFKKHVSMRIIFIVGIVMSSVYLLFEGIISGFYERNLSSF